MTTTSSSRLIQALGHPCPGRLRIADMQTLSTNA